MKKLYVFPHDHLPTRPPLIASILFYMALDVYDAPGWAWGVVGTLVFVLWVGWLILLLQQETKPLPGYGETDKAQR